MMARAVRMAGRESPSLYDGDALPRAAMTLRRLPGTNPAPRQSQHGIGTTAASATDWAADVCTSCSASCPSPTDTLHGTTA